MQKDRIRALLKLLKDDVTCAATICDALGKNIPISDETLDGMGAIAYRLIETTFEIEREVFSPAKKRKT